MQRGRRHMRHIIIDWSTPSKDGKGFGCLAAAGSAWQQQGQASAWIGRGKSSGRGSHLWAPLVIQEAHVHVTLGVYGRVEHLAAGTAGGSSGGEVRPAGVVGRTH